MPAKKDLCSKHYLVTANIHVDRRIHVEKTFESESHFATGAPASRGSRPRVVTRETWYVEKRPEHMWEPHTHACISSAQHRERQDIIPPKVIMTCGTYRKGKMRCQREGKELENFDVAWCQQLFGGSRSCCVYATWMETKHYQVICQQACL
jgi:hypothetical protein